MDDHKTSLDKLVHGIKLKLQDGSEKSVATQKGVQPEYVCVYVDIS